MAKIEYQKGKRVVSARLKIIAALLVGLAAGAAATLLGKWQVAVLAAWDAGALTYLVWTWLTVGPMDGATTEKHALREDPSRASTDTIMLCAVVGSLVAVGFMLAESSGAQGLELLAGAVFSVLSIAISWLTLHTLFVLHYAEQYYVAPKGGIDFGETKTPTYRDFAYLAFMVGMTFQVSDTQLAAKNLRGVALKHAMLSYVFGTFVIAATVNLVAGLGK